MTFVVPFDGSDLAEAALARAREYGEAMDEDVVAVSVIPESRRYAVRKGWIERGAEFEASAVAGRLRERVAEIAPDATLEFDRADPGAREGTIARYVRQHAARLDAAVVFIGSENAGRIVVSVSSVGGSVAADTRFDVHVVRHPR